MVRNKRFSAPLAIGGAVSLMVVAVWGVMQHPTGGATNLAKTGEGASIWIQSGPGGSSASSQMPMAFKTGVENLPRSLQGSEVPEGLAEDASGNLVVTQGLKDVFDYFLSASVDEPLSTLHARLVAYIQSHLGNKAAVQALAILDQYGAYKVASGDLAKSYAGDRPDQVKARFAALQNLRRSSLGPEVAKAFFGEEEVWAQYTLTKGDILQDNSLTASQKSTRIAELRRQLPPSMQESIAMSEMLQSLEDAKAQWQARGGSPEELRAAREAIVGKEGAARLEALDRENAQWESRMHAHLAQRAQIMADPGIAADMKSKRIEAMRKQNFTPDEQMRVTALEGLHDENAGNGPVTMHP